MTPEEENADAFRRLIAASDAGDLEAALAFFAPDYVDHDPSEVRRQGRSDRDGVGRAFRAFFRAFPDTRHTIHDLIAEGDRVALHVSATGTHTGEIYGIPATGARVTQTALVIYRLADGKIAERWCPHEPGVLEQLQRIARAR